jgi:hypothetical protein
MDTTVEMVLDHLDQIWERGDVVEAVVVPEDPE